MQHICCFKLDVYLVLLIALSTVIQLYSNVIKCYSCFVFCVYIFIVTCIKCYSNPFIVLSAIFLITPTVSEAAVGVAYDALTTVGKTVELHAKFEHLGFHEQLFVGIVCVTFYFF